MVNLKSIQTAHGFCIQVTSFALNPIGAPDRNRTGTSVTSWDFKSQASASSATGAYLLFIFYNRLLKFIMSITKAHNIIQCNLYKFYCFLK